MLHMLSSTRCQLSILPISLPGEKNGKIDETKNTIIWASITQVRFQVRAGSRIKSPTSSTTNAACNSNPNVTFFGIMLTTMNSGRGWHSQFFVHDLGQALALKMCHDQSQAFKVNSSHAFTVETKIAHFFWASRFQGLQGMVVQSFAQTVEELTAQGEH